MRPGSNSSGFTNVRASSVQTTKEDNLIEEVKETTDALRWVAICQMGHYRRRNGSYNPDIIAVLSDFTRYGLPNHHGITVRVSEDGQAWYGWRQTVSEWILQSALPQLRPTNGCTTDRNPRSTFRANRWYGISGFPGRIPKTGDRGHCRIAAKDELRLPAPANLTDETRCHIPPVYELKQLASCIGREEPLAPLIRRKQPNFALGRLNYRLRFSVIPDDISDFLYP